MLTAGCAGAVHVERMITLYSRNATIVRAVREAASGHPIGEIDVLTPKYADQPGRADFVVTKARLSVALERYAASKGAMIVQIPESIGYLIDKAATRDLVVIGADYQRYSDRLG